MDTIFALSSGRPPAAVSVIRISGPAAHDAGTLIAGALPQPRAAAVRELRHPGTQELLDEALVLRFDGPASATGENIVEFQCHGGRAVVDAVLAALGSLPDLRQAEPGEFTRRSFENGRIDLTEAEGLADLLEAETEAQRRAALAVAEGGLRKQIEDWSRRVVELSAMAERAIDYDEEDALGADLNLIPGCNELADELQQWLERPRVETLKDGVRVVVAGPPNAGKSSLLNAIAGSERAIVTDIPGTTRDHIEVPLVIAGIPVLLTDTAGLRESEDPVEAIGVRRASALVEAADVVVWLGDAADAPAHARVIKVHAQADRCGRYPAPADTLPISSVTGQGIAELLNQIVTMARELVPAADAIALNRRQATLVQEAFTALAGVRVDADVVLAAEGLRRARLCLDQLTGLAGVEDVLDALFARFCLGK